ncbi:MAG: hypothetical protein IPF99_43700 [Deltaproteobacteria bacterium]|nr:hypothetical protein [Deltaproteobacteria bacterium]
MKSFRIGALVGLIAMAASGTSLAQDAVGSASLAQLAAGWDHTCVRTATGQVLCWGGNYVGQLGDGTQDSRPTPTPVVGLADAVEITAGSGHTCARSTSGQVLCWGGNQYGQLGDGRTFPRGIPGRLTPTPVVGLADAVEIRAGSAHTCARRTTGEVVCWGDNQYGQLGDGTTVQRLTPTPVEDITDAVEIVAGESHTCARRATGQVLCWGIGPEGQLGNGTATRRLRPDRFSVGDSIHTGRSATDRRTMFVRRRPSWASLMPSRSMWVDGTHAFGGRRVRSSVGGATPKGNWETGPRLINKDHAHP